ncbi:MAG TPA: carboxypeptidase-like regulatory domain-containing protein [Blastocatellia bacterium]|nr:carboxypeptidase-like regulatory domain-containing protein [Blastocatellia bacterium]
MIRLSLAAIITVLFILQHISSQFAVAVNRAAIQSDQSSARAPATASAGEAITGLVLDDNGQPVEGAQIIIDRVGIRNQMQFINTDDAGRFKTPGLAPGLYAMEVHWPGYIIQPESTQPGMHRAGERLTFNMVKGGVITGRVTDTNGEPVVSDHVNANRLRDLDGRRTTPGYGGGRTDDRGVYRMYGLEPGLYIISVKAGSGVYVVGAETGDDTPTYYPSSARDTAVEITVRAGEEVSGINIQLRGERGHAISGIVSGDIGTGDTVEGVEVKLVNVSSDAIEKTANLYRSTRFAMYGIPDGEYEIYAQKLNSQDGNAGSVLRRVVLKGADLVGVDLKLIKYGSISGRVVIDSAKADQPATRCEGQARFQLEEIMLDARSDNPTRRRQDQFFKPDEYWGSWRGSVVDQKGVFAIQNLEQGLYRLNVNLPGANWFVRSIAQPAASAPKKYAEISRSGIAIKSGERLTGVEVIIAEGAASLRGRAVPLYGTQSKDRAAPAPRLQIHLLPAEESAKDDLLRYAETIAGKNGSFEFKNLAPGKYWLLARLAPSFESDEIQTRPVAWDESQRVKLRRDAKKNEIELKPCQRLDDFALKAPLP